MHWNDVEDIAMSLEENYPDEDILGLTSKDIEELIYSFYNFEDQEIKPTKEGLQEIIDAWTDIKDNG